MASWYESAEWIGVVATPHCGEHLSYLMGNYSEIMKSGASPQPINYFFIQHDVCLKDGKQHPLWVVNWPNLIPILHSGIKPLSWYYNNTKNGLIPPGTEQKYSNTEAFIAERLEEETGSA